MDALKMINTIIEPVILGEEEVKQGHIIMLCKEIPKIHDALSNENTLDIEFYRGRREHDREVIRELREELRIADSAQRYLNRVMVSNQKDELARNVCNCFKCQEYWNVEDCVWVKGGGDENVVCEVCMEDDCDGEVEPCMFCSDNCWKNSMMNIKGDISGLSCEECCQSECCNCGICGYYILGKNCLNHLKKGDCYEMVCDKCWKDKVGKSSHYYSKEAGQARRWLVRDHDNLCQQVNYYS